MSQFEADPEDADFAAEQETIIQMIAWKLFDQKARMEFPGPVVIDDARRSDIIDMLRGFRVMTELEQRKVDDLVRQWRAIEAHRDTMPGPRRMCLRLLVPGASDKQLSLGLQAAADVFAAAEVPPHVAAFYASIRDLQDDRYGFDENARGYPKPLTREEHRAADAWIEAGDVAIAACCAGWTKRPMNAGLSLLRNPPAVPLRGPQLEFEAE